MDSIKGHEWNPRDLVSLSRRSLSEKMNFSRQVVGVESKGDSSIYSRIICDVNGTSVGIFHPELCQTNIVSMFGSNNYLGLATDVRVREAAKRAIDDYGVGICGSSVLNGNSKLQKELEEATAFLKGAEDCIVFSSGYNANLAWINSLVRPNDVVIFDAEAHMSFREGIKGVGPKQRKFKHNSIQHLSEVSSKLDGGDSFLFVEGLYSMHGDIADVEAIQKVAARIEGFLVIDDAHGTGTLGATGRGVAEVLSQRDNIVSVGTYSKALGSNGGFICGNKDLISCIRVLSAPYMFSAALSPANMAGALQSINILLEEPERVLRLRENARLANRVLRKFGNISEDISPIVYLRLGQKIDVMSAAKALERAGYFVNPIAFPAVGRNDSGLRISICSEHTEGQIYGLEQGIDSILSQVKAG